MAKKIVTVLIVDDSLFIRETLKERLNEDEGINVVDTAVDAYDARDKILEYDPDVLILDVQMPKMDGITFLKKLLPQYPIPVVVMSAIDTMVFEALKYGAVEFVSKPNTVAENNLDAMVKELLIKVKIASIAKVPHIHKDRQISEGQRKSIIKIIAIGASTGGTEALFEVLNRLPGNLPGIVIVQHMPPVFTKMYAQRLNGICNMIVKEAQNGDEIMPGIAYIAPGGMQMSLKMIDKKVKIKLFNGEKRNGHNPSVDVLFDSVADIYGKYALGVILTGMGNDGAEGLLRMRKAGAITIGQNEKTSVVYGMPRVAYEIGGVKYQLPIQEIGNKIKELTK